MMRALVSSFGVAALAGAALGQNAWTPGFETPGLGLNGPAYQLLPFAGELIAVGGFFEAGGVRTNYVAAFNGTSWRPLGTGGAFNGGGFSNAAYCATVFRGQLVAGGFFTQLGRAGGTTVNRVARWDGAAWQPLGACPGLTGGFGQVRSLAVHNDRLYAGGSFDHAGCVVADNLAVWDGLAWAGITGVGGETDDFVNALVSHGDLLVIGGQFDHAGPLAARGLAALQGAIFVPIAGDGLGFIGSIEGLASIGGQLYAGGNFDTVAGVPAEDVARYDGAWHALDGGIFGVGVASFAEFEGRLHAGGLFSDAGGAPVNSVASWDGAAWAELDDGVNGYVTTMAVFQDALFLGGTFTRADGIESSRIARWGRQPCAADFDGNGFLDFFDYLDYVTAFETGDPRADFDGNEFVDFFDYLDFVTAFEAGC